jgi:glutathione S-transferase
MLATGNGVGQMEKCMPFEDTTKPEFLAINPFHAVPALTDGDFCLAESGAILRYISSYVPDTYPEDPKVRGFINWAMDRFSGTNYKDAITCIYPILGFAGPPADQAAAGKAATDNLKEFADFFLKGKFIGGEKLSIADYKVAPFFYAFEHQAVQEKSMVVCPDRVKQFNKDFAEAVGDAAGLLVSAGGFALKEMLDAKLEAAAPGAAAEPAKDNAVEEKPEPLPDTAVTVEPAVEIAQPASSCCC